MTIITSKPTPAPSPYRYDGRRDFQIRGRYDHPIAKLANCDIVQQTQATAHVLAASFDMLVALKRAAGELEYLDKCSIKDPKSGEYIEVDSETLRVIREGITKGEGDA
jgi:hypothetical protein